MNELEIVKPATLQEYLSEAVKRIVAFDEGTKVHFKLQMGCAYMAGMELICIKEKLKHGEFEPFLKAKMSSLPERSRQRYMLFAEKLSPQIRHVADFRPEVLQITNSQIPESVKKEVCEAVYKFADGKSLTELYRDLGVIKPKAKDGGFRPNAKSLLAWLKQHHPSFAGIPYAELPPAIQKAFKKQYVPEVDPQDIVKLARSTFMRRVGDVLAGIDDKEHIHLIDEEKQEAIKQLKDALNALYDISKPKKGK